MSIVDSTEDLEAAKARIATVDETELVEDLRFWSIAEADAKVDHMALAEQQAAVMRRYQEATHWTSLIGAELRQRREARTGRTPVTD